MKISSGPPPTALSLGGGNSVGERLRGNTIRGNRTESLREETLPLRLSLKGPPKASERYTGNEDSVTKGTSPRVFGGPLGDPLGGRFSNRVAP